MSSLNHLHTYNRMKNKRYFRCIHKGCTHFINKELLSGKECTCPLCFSTMLMTKEQLRRAVPRCINCSNTKAKAVRDSAMDLLQELNLEI